MTKFWQKKSLAEMTSLEWESLCDGCGKCCLNKLEDEDSGEIAYTAVTCHLLDAETCRCSNYPKRKTLVPDCSILRSSDLSALNWLPTTCAYRLLAEGQALPHWHHLVSGDREDIHRQGMSVQGKVLSEEHVHPDDLNYYVITWVNTQ